MVFCRTQLNFVLASLIGVIFAGCTNNIFRSISQGGNGNGVIAPPPSTSQMELISRVLRNTSDPSNVFDLVGDGSGNLGKYCISSELGSTTPLCNCYFTYYMNSDKSDTPQILEVASIHQESNLVRCYFGKHTSEQKSDENNYPISPGIAPEAAVVEVQLSFPLNPGMVSNVVSFQLNGANDVSDSFDISSYATVKRFQCKEALFISNPFDYNGGSNRTYDPIQSVDPKLVFPMNFYSTNFGRTYSYYANKNFLTFTPTSSTNNWICPEDPENDPYQDPLNDPPTLYKEDYQIFSAYYNGLITTGAGFSNNYKIAIDGSTYVFADRRIYPFKYPNAALLAAGEKVFDRSSFVVSKKKTGPFSVPLNALAIPGRVTSEAGELKPDKAIPPLGYVAKPIQSGSKEICPRTVSLPDGYQWVKVWLMRTTLMKRNAVVSTDLATGKMLHISCNPGRWLAGTDIFSDCAGLFGIYNNVVPAHDIYARVLGTLVPGVQNTNLCVDALQGGLNGIGIHAEDGILSDGWRVRTASCTNFTNNNITAPMNVCVNQGADGGGFQRAFPKSVTGSGSSNQVSYLDIDGGGIRYEFLFVVTPDAWTMNDMETHPQRSIFWPIRFKAGECTARVNDPAVDGATENIGNPKSCIDAGYTPEQYGPKKYDIGEPSDPPAGDTRPGVFPVCAIQKIPTP